VHTVPRSQGRGPDRSWDWRKVHAACLTLARRHAAGADAEDIAQESLIRAWRFRAKLRHGQPNGWLATIVRNEAARQFARPRAEPIGDVDAGQGAEDEALTGIVIRAEIESAVAELDSSERQLLELRYAQDLTQPAISKLLNVPEGTVKVRLHRARAKLHRALSQR
jgi:RNA polymerase sigma-70 factor (ECF subfamily)